MDEANARLRAHGYRLTAQRKAVLKTLTETDRECAQSVEDVHAKARLHLKGIGLTTIYRTLQILAAGGLVEEIYLGDGRVRYELADREGHHHHLICLLCGRVRRVKPCVLAPAPEIAGAGGFRVTGHRLELVGYCPACQ